MANEPTDKALYARVKAAAKKKFKVYPSAYANAWLVREYKKRGGKYKTVKKRGKSDGLTRWFKEDWRDIKTGKKCGRSGKDKKKRPYPACRPSKRVSSKTPKTSGEMSSAEKARMKKAKTSSKKIPYSHQRKRTAAKRKRS